MYKDNFLVFDNIRKNESKENYLWSTKKKYDLFLKIVFHYFFFFFLKNNLISQQAKERKLGDSFSTHLRLLPNIIKKIEIVL